MSTSVANNNKRNTGIALSFAGIITAFGIALGDLSTSIVYAFKAITLGQGGSLGRPQVIGLLSLILWSLILSATLKYAVFVMRADNKGEGGVFAMFSLVRKYWRYMPMIAIIGGAFLLADSVITPANSILSAVEGIGSIDFIRSTGQWQQEIAVMIAIIIIVLLFSFQHSGTGKVGKLFGPIMITYLIFSAVVGVYWFSKDYSIIQALNPIEGIRFFISSDNKIGLAVLSGVFLAITGAEALSADQGQLGRSNIRIAWAFAFICIMLSYFGQGAYMLQHPDLHITGADASPYFLLVPEIMRPFSVVLALLAGVVASQALITASFSLAANADGLGWLPRLKASYTGNTKGQVYIPAVNTALCVATIGLILFFQSSSNMEAAYGLALVVAMLMDTVMLWFWFIKIKKQIITGTILCLFFGLMEALFLTANISKFVEGGYVTILLALAMMITLYICMKGQKLELNRRSRIHADKLATMLSTFISDDKIDLVSDNLVYLTPDMNMNDIEKDIAVSMLHHRAHIYWVVSIVQSDSPFSCEYTVKSYDNVLYRVRIKLGYKQPQYYLQAYMRRIMRDMIRTKEIQKIKPIFPELATKNEKAGLGTVKYVLMHRVISPESELPDNDKTILRMFQVLKKWIARPIEWFGLEASSPLIETVSLFRGDEPDFEIKRIKTRTTPSSQSVKIKTKNTVNNNADDNKTEPAIKQDNDDNQADSLSEIVTRTNEIKNDSTDDDISKDETIVMNPIRVKEHE